MGIEPDKNRIRPKIFLDNSNKNPDNNSFPEEKPKELKDKAPTFTQYLLPSMDLSQVKKSREQIGDSRSNVNVEWEVLGKKDLG